MFEGLPVKRVGTLVRVDQASQRAPTSMDDMAVPQEARWGVDTRTSNDPRDRHWWPNGEHNPQQPTTQSTESVMAKVLADARIDEMLATAERHRLRQLGRRQRHRATEEPYADHPRQTTRPYPAIVNLSTTSNADAETTKANMSKPDNPAEPGRRRTLCDAISRLMGEPTAKEKPMGKISPQTEVVADLLKAARTTR